MHRLARNDMIIDKNIKSKVNIDYLFIEGKVKIDAKYFINQIDQNCHVSNTHIVGEMTNFNFFNADKKFEEFLVVVLKELDKHVFLRKYSFKEAEYLNRHTDFYIQTKTENKYPVVKMTITSSILR